MLAAMISMFCGVFSGQGTNACRAALFQFAAESGIEVRARELERSVEQRVRRRLAEQVPAELLHPTAIASTLATGRAVKFSISGPAGSRVEFSIGRTNGQVQMRWAF